MPNIILSDTSASVSELKKILWLQSVPEMVTLSPFLTGISRHSTVCLLNCMKGCLMLWMTGELVKLVTERSNQPLHDVDLDSYL